MRFFSMSCHQPMKRIVGSRKISSTDSKRSRFSTFWWQVMRNGSDASIRGRSACGQCPGSPWHDRKQTALGRSFFCAFGGVLKVLFTLSYFQMEKLSRRTCIDEQMRRVAEKIRQFAIGMSSRDRPILLHDNAKPYTASQTKSTSKAPNFEVLPHPPYSPDLSPSDYRLFRSVEHSHREQTLEYRDHLEKLLSDFFLLQIIFLFWKKEYFSLKKDGKKYFFSLEMFRFFSFQLFHRYTCSKCNTHSSGPVNWKSKKHNKYISNVFIFAVCFPPTTFTCVYPKQIWLYMRLEITNMPFFSVFGRLTLRWSFIESFDTIGSEFTVCQPPSLEICFKLLINSSSSG